MHHFTTIMPHVDVIYKDHQVKVGCDITDYASPNLFLLVYTAGYFSGS